MQKTNNEAYAFLRDKTNDELRELLRRDLEQPEEASDFELLLQVMGELERREKQNGERRFAGEDEALQRLHASLGRAAPKPRLRWLRYAGLAAVLALVFLAGTLFPRWHSREEGTAESGFDYALAYGEVEAALEEHGIAAPALPQWLPDQVAYTDVEVSEGPKKTTVRAYAYDEAGDDAVVLQVEKDADGVSNAVSRAMSGSGINVYEVHGTRYYVQEGDGLLRIFWSKGNLHISMDFADGDVDARRIIDSVDEAESTPSSNAEWQDWRGSAGASGQQGLVDELTPVYFPGTSSNPGGGWK